jgi:hypothetical protein
LRMVAEATLFLSKDRELQVRAHRTGKGKEVFCVKDFIRTTASKQMGPDDAMVYWLSSMARLAHEREVMDSRMVQFLGPYEKEQVCLSAEGLLILYHYLSERFPWVDPVYRQEVVEVLSAVAHRKGWERHVEMHDDGEVDALVAERGDRELDGPPEGSRFLYLDSEEGGVTMEEAHELLEESKKTAARLREEVRMRDVELVAVRAELKEHERMRDAKRRKGAGFKLSALIDEKKYPMAAAVRDQVCKKVIASFRARFPEHETFMKHGAVHFYAEDEGVVKELLVEELESLDD